MSEQDRSAWVTLEQYSLEVKENERLREQLVKAEDIIKQINNGSFMDSTIYDAIRAASSYDFHRSAPVLIATHRSADEGLPSSNAAGAGADTALTDEQQNPKGVYGEMCRDPKICAGKGYCPRDPSCCE